MSPRLIKTGQMLLIVAMFAACGGHWALLQSVAWTKMLVSFSQTGELTTAIAKTFDGRHPCPLCKQIKTGEAKEKKQEVQVVAKKLDLFHQPSVITLTRPEEFQVYEVLNCAVVKRVIEPPTPPPQPAMV